MTRFGPLNVPVSHLSADCRYARRVVHELYAGGPCPWYDWSHTVKAVDRRVAGFPP